MMSQEQDVLPGTTAVLVKLTRREKAQRFVGIKRRRARDKAVSLEET